MKDSKKENLSPEDEAGRLVGLHGLSSRSVAADRLERAHQLGLTDVVDHWYRVYRLLSESAGRPAKAPPSGVSRRSKMLPRLPKGSTKASKVTPLSEGIEVDPSVRTVFGFE